MSAQLPSMIRREGEPCSAPGGGGGAHVVPPESCSARGGGNVQCPRRRLTVTLVKGGCRAPGGGAQCPQWGGCVRSAPGGGRSALWWKNAKGKTIRNFNPVLHPVFVYQEGGNSPPDDSGLRPVTGFRHQKKTDLERHGSNVKVRIPTTLHGWSCGSSTAAVPEGAQTSSGKKF